VIAMTHLPRIQLPATEIDPNTVRPGWVALLIVLALGGATVLLWRNMGKQLKKIDFDPNGGQPVPPEEPVAGPAPSGDQAATPDSSAPAGDAVQIPTPPHHPGQGPKATSEDPAHH
jgi:hypothetical protein